MENPKTFTKPIEIRWGDLDANRHVGNTAYVEYLNSARMALLASKGFGQAYLAKHQVGPVILNETFSYKNEIMGDDETWAEIELGGYSEDFRFFEFHQQIHTKRKGLSCFSTVTYAWLDLKARKITPLNNELRSFLSELKKSERFRILTKENMPN